MAIIIVNSSTCSLCNATLTNQEEYILIPPLISNMNDPLFKVSDSGLHKKCLNQSKIKERLLKYISIYDKRPKLSELKCTIDNSLIADPSKIIMIGLLTSNEQEILHKFNYINLNKDNIWKWKEKNNFIKASESYLKENKWIPFADYNYLEYILNEVKNNA